MTPASRPDACLVAHRGTTYRRLALVAALLVLLVPLLTAGGAARAAGAPVGGRSAARAGVGTTANDGAVVVKETPIAPHVVDLTIKSPALNGTGMVRLYLPTHWESSPRATFPELWLLPGSNDATDYRSWDTYTTVRKFLTRQDVVTVMPADGKGGMFSDEWNYGLPGGTNYETFHTVEVAQIIDRGYRGNGHRAVAGLSAGGLGAIHYAQAHPDMFKAAASYSGLLDIMSPILLPVLMVVRGGDNKNFYTLWGDQTLQNNIWKAHDPNSNVSKLRGTALYISAGDGKLGPCDQPGKTAMDNGGVIETYSQDSTSTFVNTVQKAGIPATVHLYSGGTHSWGYWDREFKRSWPVLLKGLSGVGAPAPPMHQAGTSPASAPAPWPTPGAVLWPAAPQPAPKAAAHKPKCLFFGMFC